MSQSDEFDDLDSADNAAEQSDQSDFIKAAEPAQKSRLVGVLSKVLVVLIVVGAVGFYLMRSSSFPFAIAQAPVTEQSRAAQVEMPAPVAPQPAPVAEADPLAPPAQISVSDPAPAPMMPAAEAAPQMPLPVTPAEPVASADEFKVEPIKTDTPTATAADSLTVPAQPAIPEQHNIHANVEPQPVHGEQTLEKRMSTLEQKLEAIQGQMVTRIDLDSALEQAVGKKRRSASATDGATATDAPVVKTVKKKKAKSASSTAVHRARWTLRAAKPGMAWVSESATGPLRPVSVGDNLTGIGKVTSIHKDSLGGWVVNGTQGRISQ